MADNFLDIIDFEHLPGFNNALFVSVPKFGSNMSTPMKDYLDADVSKLSIDCTPNKTPKTSDQNLNFKFCLTKDLLTRLDETSPVTVYKRCDPHTKTSEIFLSSIKDIKEVAEEDEENQKKSASKLSLKTPYNYKYSNKSLFQNNSIFNTINKVMPSIPSWMCIECQRINLDCKFNLIFS